MIDQLTIDRIMDAANIVDVVSEFVTLRKRGVNYIGLCPFHSDRTPSFSVSPSKGICKCFACGKGGNVVHFIMEHEQLTYPEALKWLANKYGIPIQEKELTEEQKQNLNLHESLFVVNQFANDYFQTQIELAKKGATYFAPGAALPSALIALQYFRSRGFRDDTIKKFQLGHCTPLLHGFSDIALKAGYKKEYLLKTGLCYQKDDGTLVDRFRGRVIFPIHSLSGKVVGFGGRVLDSRTKGVQMKYVNSPESEIYHKSRELYGLYFGKSAIVRNDKCFLVEGYTDVISMHQSGVENVVASSGTALTQEQIRLIHRFTRNITLLFDGDAAGIKASLRGIDMLLQEGMNVKVCLLPDGDDPDSFARKHNATEFQQFIADHEQDFIVFKANLLLDEAGKDLSKRVQLISSIVGSIAVIPDAIARSVYIHECSELLQVEERMMVSEVAKKSKSLNQTIMINARTPEQFQQQMVAEPPSPKELVDAFQEMTEDDIYKGTSKGTQYSIPIPSSMGQPPRTALAFNTSETLAQSTLSAIDDVQDVMLRQEQDIIRLIICYGERVMCLLQIGEAQFKELRVLEAVAQSLKDDKLSFRYPIHEAMINQACQAMMNDKTFNAEKFFVRHPDATISRYAVDLIANRYSLHETAESAQKQSDEERLCELVPMLLNTYKLTVVRGEMKQIQEQLSTPEVAYNADKATTLMRRYTELQNIQNELAKLTGDRVVMRF